MFWCKQAKPIPQFLKKRKTFQSRKCRQENVRAFHLQVVQFFYFIGNTRLFEQFLPLGVGVGRSAFGIDIGRIDFVVERRAEFHHFRKQLFGKFSGDTFGFPAFYQLQEDVAYIAGKSVFLFQCLDMGCKSRREVYPFSINEKQNQCAA